MLYLGIDLHLKQLTVSLRNEDGDVVRVLSASVHEDFLGGGYRWLSRQKLAEDSR
jgi:hypothetical protein